MATSIKWEDADFLWSDNPYTWEDVAIVTEVVEEIEAIEAIQQGGGDFDEEIYKYDAGKKRKLIKLILKVRGMDGDTITEQKYKEIKQYKITAKDIKLVVKEVLGVEMIAEDVSI